MRWAEYVARIGIRAMNGGILVETPVGKGPPRRLRRRWTDNIKIDLRDGMVWTGLVWLTIDNIGSHL
jgi:hypothetical protein